MSPYHKYLTAHNGNIDPKRSAQSGVWLKGRDRSKTAMFKKEEARKRALEESDDDEEILSPTKKVCGVLWAKLAHIG
jgi:hypothetical protein